MAALLLWLAIQALIEGPKQEAEIERRLAEAKK